MSYEKLHDGRRQVTGFRFPGDLLSLSFEDGGGPIEVEAISSAAICSIGSEALHNLRRRNPDLSDRLLSLADRELSWARQHIILLGRKSAHERVASFFVDILRRAGHFKDGAWEIWLPMKRQDIADYLGLKIETVSRMMTQLREAGVVHLPTPSRVRVDELDTLLEMACMAPTTVSNKVGAHRRIDS
jgi:CRP/FNR family transcriptional regulator